MSGEKMKKPQIIIVFLITCLISISIPISIRAIETENNEIPSSFSTPLQAALAQTLYAYENYLGEDVPSAEYFDYENGTSLTILDYHNGTIKHVTETFTIGSVLLSTTDSDPFLQEIPTVEGEATEIETETQDILMGFTISLPTLSWGLLVEDPIFGFDFLDVGIEFAFGFGVRLPVRITLKYPEEMAIEHDYTLNATISSLNWNSVHYSNAGLTGIAAEQYEFLCKFLCAFWLEVFEADIIDFSLDIDESRDFYTPIGPAMEFPLPQIPIDLTSIISAILHVDISGALGLLLILDPHLGSSKITADWSATGDATGGETITWTDNGDTAELHVSAGDHSPDDYAYIGLTNFKYYFTDFWIDFIIKVDFRGIIDFIPDIYLNLFRLDLSWLLGGGFPLGTHSGTVGNMDISIFVEKFGVDLNVAPTTQDIIPGESGTYYIDIENTGNVHDTFSLTVEDLPSNWLYSFSESEVSLDPGESTTITLEIEPYRHWTTTPGDYEFSVNATSNEAPLRGLSASDIKDIITHVLPFHDVELYVTPSQDYALPGETKFYLVVVLNLGNVEDDYELTIEFLEIPSSWHAVPKKIQIAWIDLAPVCMTLGPGTSGGSSLSIQIPSDWAGMEDTNYTLKITSTCVSDPLTSDSKLASLIAKATKESKARYIDYELEWLAFDVLGENIPENIKLSLLAHLNAAINKKEKALLLILTEREKQANNMLNACKNIIMAFNHLIEAQYGKKIPVPLADKWIEKANTFILYILDTIGTPI